MNFSRSYRASIDRIESISFVVPDADAQNAAMAEVIELERKIAEAEKQLANISSKKAAVLEKYL